MRVRINCIRRQTCSVALLCCWCILFSQAISAQTANRGVIEGRVVNEKGLPVPQAQAYALSDGFTVAAIRYVGTDNDGRFRLDRLSWGKYHVFARKLSAGYGDMSFNFYPGYAPEATISPSSPGAVVTVQVGPPCGFLKVTSVTAAVTGEPIKDYALTLQWASDPHRVIGGNLPKPVLIPSNIDILVEVSAKGYETWPPVSERTTIGKIRLKPGEVFELRVTLHSSAVSKSP